MKIKKIVRRLLSLWLSLVMIVSNLAGLVPGMSLTAYADTPYGSYLVNDEDDSDSLPGKVVHFNGFDWYIIKDESTSATSGTVTLLAQGTAFGTAKFHDSYTEPESYASSTLKGYLDSIVAGTAGTGKPDFSGVASAINDAGNGKLYLLSVDEAEAVPREVLKADFPDGGYQKGWWLRTPDSEGDYYFVRIVTGDLGLVVLSPTYDAELGVRPALKLDLSKVTFDSSAKKFELTPVVEYPLWVGGVQVTSENKDDVLGVTDEGATVVFTPAVDDNAATTDVDESSPATLTLNGADISGGNNDSKYAAIYAEGLDLTIHVTENSTVTGPKTNDLDNSEGIYIYDGCLTITGSGRLTTTGGEIANGYGCSYGIDVDGAVTINGPLNANGGETQYAVSCGIYAGNGITVRSSGTLAASGGTGEAGSYGIWANVTVDGSLSAIGNSQAIYGTVKNSITGTGWTDTEGTMGKASIAVSEAGQELNSYKKVQFPAVPDPVAYIDHNATTGTAETKACTNHTAFVEGINSTLTTIPAGWYVILSGNAVATNRLVVNGTVNLILCDGATLIARRGITVTSGNTLNIYAGSMDETILGTGKLYAGTTDGISSTCEGEFAGIGGNVGAGGGTVTIHGGEVTALGNTKAAGIGGGNGGAGGTVTIYGGTVTASGDGQGKGMGIGAGHGGSGNGTLTIGTGLAVFTSNDNSNWTDTTSSLTTRTHYMKVVSTVPVTVVSLDKTDAQTINVGGSVSFNATVTPDGVTDKTVKWSVGGTNASAVTLYSDEACTTAVGTDATSTLTVYAKGISAGSATITATSNADSTKSASCEVTVNEAQTQTEELLTTITGAGANAATATSANVSYSTEGVATLTFSEPTSDGHVAYLASPAWGWWGYAITLTVTPAEGYTFTKCIFYDDANRTATDSSSPFVVETTEKDKTPRVNGNPILADTSKGITKIEVYGYATPAATHNVNITSGDNMTKTETSGAASQTGLSGAMIDVIYTADDGYYFPTNYSVVSVNGISVTRNSFTQITVSGTPTADAAITLPAPTAKTDQTAPTGLIATKASSSTATDGKIGGVNDDMEYQIDGATTWTAVGAGKTEITGLTTGTYKVRYVGTADKNASPETTVTIGVKEDQTAPTGLTATKASSSTATDGKISGVNDDMEYRKDGDAAWTAVGAGKTEITGLTSGTYKVRYAGTADKNASPETTIVVGVKENQTAPTGLTATKASSNTATDGKISGVNDDMEYQIDGATIWTAVGASKTEITGLTAGTYKVRYVGTADKNVSPETTVTIGVKEDQTAPTGLTATKASSSTATDGKISGVNDDMEYRKDGDAAWTAVGAGKTEIAGLTSGTYKVRYVGTADKNASPAVTVEVGVKVAPIVTAPTAKTLTYDGSVQALVNAGITTGGTMNYAVSTNSATAPSTGWSTSIPTATDAGTYYVWYKVVGDANHNDTVADHVEVTIAKKPISLSSDQLPKANTGLEEKYGTQALVTAPKAALPAGYTMVYALGKDGVNAPAEGYGIEIPSGSKSGNYYVWYKAVSSDSNYADTEPVCITVSIAQTVYFSVIFEMNGHGKQIASQAVEYGTKLNKPEDPVAEGYIFDGWYTDKECTAAYDFDSKVEKGFTLYAKWTAEGTEETVSLNSIAITTAPSKTEYKEGEKFDPAGMVVTATYTDKSCKAVTGYTYTPDGALSVSDNKITVSYTEDGITCTAEQPISVSANGGSEPAAVSLNSISITTAPAKTEYKEGEKFDPTGMVVTATYTDNSSKAVTGYTYTPDGALSVSDDKITISYTEEGITCTAIQSIKVNANGGGEIIIDPDEVDVWNLFESDEAHEYILKGVSASENIANSNDNSKKYYDAVLEGDTIKVSLKSGAKRNIAASKSNAVLSFVLSDGSRVDYTLPVVYEKTALKLSSTSATIKDGAETNVETTILVKRKGGQYEALDLSDATVTYGSAEVDTDEGGKVIITASKGMKGNISVLKPGWESAIGLKYTINAVKKDVLTVELGGIKTVVLNANAPDQSHTFPVLLNGAAAGEVEVNDGKTGIASYSDGFLTIAYPEGGVKAGNYTVNLTSGEAKCSVKVKVSAKDLSKAVTLKIKSKYDIVTGEPMRLEAKLKDISGVITEVAVDKEGFSAEIDENGYILVSYEGNAFDSGSTKIGNMTFSLSISDVEEPVMITLKNVKARKARLTVKAAAVTLAKDASEVNAVANIVCTYKDSKGVTHLIRPENTEIKLTNVEAEVSAEDTGLINISKLSKKKGTIKATLTFKGGVKKKVTITVKRAKK